MITDEEKAMLFHALGMLLQIKCEAINSLRLPEDPRPAVLRAQAQKLQDHAIALDSEEREVLQ